MRFLRLSFLDKILRRFFGERFFRQFYSLTRSFIRDVFDKICDAFDKICDAFNKICDALTKICDVLDQTWTPRITDSRISITSRAQKGQQHQLNKGFLLLELDVDETQIKVH